MLQVCFSASHDTTSSDIFHFFHGIVGFIALELHHQGDLEQSETHYLVTCLQIRAEDCYLLVPCFRWIPQLILIGHFLPCVVEGDNTEIWARLPFAWKNSLPFIHRQLTILRIWPGTLKLPDGSCNWWFSKPTLFIPFPSHGQQETWNCMFAHIVQISACCLPLAIVCLTLSPRTYFLAGKGFAIVNS